MSDSIILTTFTDPMMGLTYEMEPIYDRLEREFGERIAFKWVMALLVRDVSDFMTSEERALEPGEGIRRYNARLAQIYKSEEAVGGLPINMEGFCLFDPEHRTSKPLNLAYKAAQLADPERADTFLRNLRHATVIDCLPTTHTDVILEVVRRTGIDGDAFLRHFNGGAAEEALARDLAFAVRLGIRSLPTCLIQSGERAMLLRSFDGDDFVRACAGLPS